MDLVIEAVPVHLSVSRPDTLLDLMEIFEPDCQIAVAARLPVAAIDPYLALAAVQMGEGFRIVLKPGDGLPLHLLPAAPGREIFATDIACLVEIYADLLGCPAIGLRLEGLGRSMCPRFHVDHTGIRLLCTYRGPGTEWLEEEAADRARLGLPSVGICDDESGIMLDPAGVRRIEPYAIALLKGSKWQGNAGRGVIHRSPKVSAEAGPRVLLALDALW